VLSDALSPSAYLGLQQQLLMRGLLQELEIPCSFESSEQQQQQEEASASSSTSSSTGDNATAAPAAASELARGGDKEDAAAAPAADAFVEYGVYKQTGSSNAEEQQQQQGSALDTFKAAKLSKRTMKKLRKQALHQEAERIDSAFDFFGRGADVGQYSPQYKWSSAPWGSSSSSGGLENPWASAMPKLHDPFNGLYHEWDRSWCQEGDGSSTAQEAEGDSEQQQCPAEQAGSAADAAAAEGPAAALAEEWLSSTAAGTAEAAEAADYDADQREQRWQQMLQAERQWVDFAGLDDNVGDVAAAAATAEEEGSSDELKASAEQQQQQQQGKKKGKKNKRQRKKLNHKAVREEEQDEEPMWARCGYDYAPYQPDSMSDVEYELLLQMGFFKDGRF
jgi:hypothetical protein